MAAEARAEIPAPAAPPLPAAASPEKRVLPGDAGKEERPETKRRRACVAALDSVPCAAPPLANEDGADGSSFSFQHARGGFVTLETTPKFGSFNPPAAAAAPKPAPPAGQGSPEDGLPVASAREEGEGKDGNSERVGADGQRQKT
ncbi:hypothetical protein GUJ93_ZPchr0001g31430 [Zizania palustris]|uniref:Uncharacterized protein n=1 Tax=Zizania palustris TaxID=103762 RepID=A0A8J5RAC5_ZIZPA|nr:hypothetical protein GUJ93_ZPchr0001g31430 [Zizania palustris]